MARAYNTLGRRILSVLAIGGPRKRTVLLGLALSLKHTESRFDRTVERLLDSKLIRCINQRRGGLHYALAKQKTT